MVSGTIEPMGTMLAGQTADALYASIAHADLLSVGLNCATGPEFMTDHIRTLHEMASTRISCYPNAGLPNEEGKYLETPQSLAAQLEKFADSRLAQHRRRLLRHHARAHPRHRPDGGGQAPAPAAAAAAPRLLLRHRTGRSRGHPTVPCIVGERTNVIGSRLFKNMIAEEKWEEATEIARRQVRNGAHIVDVCLQSTDRDEIARHPAVLREADPQDQGAHHDRHHRPERGGTGAHLLPGQGIINSINLEDGEEKFERICPHRAEPTAPRWWSAPSTRTSCRRRPSRASANSPSPSARVDLLTEKYGIPPEDIIIDPLVFPCATGDENYIGGAVETIEAIRLIKEHIPHVKTILGISNISFGLPAAAREVVNSVFLYYCTKAGLDLAIVNSEKLERFASIPEEERRLAENLLFNRPAADMRSPRGLAPADPEQKAPSTRSTSPRSPSISAKPTDARRRRQPTCRSTSAWPTTSSRAPRTDSIADLELQARRRRRAARNHQRSADGRHGRSRPPVQ